MKKLFFYAAALLAAISFAACSDDDETNLPVTSASIAGTWQITHEDGWVINSYGNDEKYTWSNNYPDENGFYWTLNFDKNGSYIETSYEDASIISTQNYTYSISGNTLMLKNDEDPNFTDIYLIKSLTESELVLLQNNKSDNITEEYIDTYKRIE